LIHSQINPSYVGNTYLTREWFHENIQGKDCLLLTIGDSWTWGDSLGNIDMGQKIYDDYDYRTSHVYGFHLSKMLDTDWVNIGIAGGCNLLVMQEAYNFIQSIQKSYKKIFVVITLTELGRELLDVYTYDAWINEFRAAVKEYTDLDDLLIKCEAYTFNLINNLFPNVLVGRNFTHTYKQNKSILGNKLLPNIWTDIIATEGNLAPYPDDIKILSGMGIDPIIKFGTKIPKEQLINLMDCQELGFNWLTRSPYNSGAGTKHPNEQAHEWWAQYLYKSIQL
jgi:hypothetical protein